MKKEATLTKRLRHDLQMRFHWGCLTGEELEVQIRKRWVGTRKWESLPEASHMEHLAVLMGLTGQLSIEVILAGEPATIKSEVKGVGMFMALVDVLIGLPVFERGGAVIEIKERMLKGDARIDSGDKMDGEAFEDDGGDERGSMTQVFFNMAGSNFLSNDLVLPLRSRTGKAKQGSISACKQDLMN